MFSYFSFVFFFITNYIDLHLRHLRVLDGKMRQRQAKWDQTSAMNDGTGIAATRSIGWPAAVSVPFPSRSHQFLPPIPHNPLSASTHSLGRQSVLAEREREWKHSQGNSTPKGGILRRFKKIQTTMDGVLGNAIAPHQLPEALCVFLEVIDTGVFDGHQKLSEALKKDMMNNIP